MQHSTIHPSDSATVVEREPNWAAFLLLCGIWVCYVVGAIGGSALELRMALFALVFPLCVLVVLVVIDVFRPFEA